MCKCVMRSKWEHMWRNEHNADKKSALSTCIIPLTLGKHQMQGNWPESKMQSVIIKLVRTYSSGTNLQLEGYPAASVVGVIWGRMTWHIWYPWTSKEGALEWHTVENIMEVRSRRRGTCSISPQSLKGPAMGKHSLWWLRGFVERCVDVLSETL